MAQHDTPLARTTPSYTILVKSLLPARLADSPRALTASESSMAYRGTSTEAHGDFGATAYQSEVVTVHGTVGVVGQQSLWSNK